MRSYAPNPDVKPINDGTYGTWAAAFRAGTPQKGKPAWVAIQVGAGPKKVLCLWSESGSPDYTNTTYGSPADYRIQVSADSTNGEDGSWRTVVSVENNRYHARGHSFDFTGQSWVKLELLRAPDPSPNGIALDELEVYDMSGGGTDTWFFMGDSITAAALRRNSERRRPAFDELVEEAVPDHHPAVINGGVGGQHSGHALQQIDEWLAVNPDFKYWAIGYGTNDAAGNTEGTDAFKSNMHALIERIVKANRIPVIAQIPYATDGSHAHVPSFNRVLLELGRKHELPAGPDLYRWFLEHPEQLEDRLHPDDRGCVSINRLWWEAVRPLYGR